MALAHTCALTDALLGQTGKPVLVEKRDGGMEYSVARVRERGETFYDGSERVRLRRFHRGDGVRAR